MRLTRAEIDGLRFLSDQHPEGTLVVEERKDPDGSIGFLVVEGWEEGGLAAQYTLSPIGRIWNGPPSSRREQIRAATAV